MADYEKKQNARDSVSSVEDGTKSPRQYNEEDLTLVDPDHDTLHRGLSARQISMIAVSIAIFIISL